MMFFKNKQLPALKKIKKLLYGLNYEVWFNIYGPSDKNVSLDNAVKELISRDTIFQTNKATTFSKLKEDVLAKLLYEGDIGSGPKNIDKKRTEIINLANEVFDYLNVNEAEYVSEFQIAEGHPDYPVFWEFAYDIHVGDKRFIFLGCSSD